ncbi:MAG: sugar porter family MFS transporter [Verrucomicrobia bacterium]|nr:sugar porter family MFS transporter [Verrucomicrobiota bacterium]MDA1065804.1 sugar porter family MFS transporter [Verrucomicrobiota bacterium]
MSHSKSSNSRLFVWALTSALAGFIFGFDTVVISGAEQSIQKLWGLGDELHGLVISAALWGTVLGALLGGIPTDLFGRKKTLIWVGALYFVSAIGSAIAPEAYTLMIARFIGGVGVGISTVAAPLYISEISPADKRGRLAGMFQFNIVFGILVAFLSNFLLGGLGENAWRWMLGIEAIPALIYSVMCFGIPESPRWLIGKLGKRAEGIEILKAIHPEYTENQLESKADEIQSASVVTKTSARFWTSRLKIPILLAFFIAFFNQLSGINAVLYFAPRIFEMTGLGEKAALLQSIGIGVTNLLFTFLGLYLIDRLGRRTLLYIGSIGYITSLGLCSWAFFSENYVIVPVCIFAFIASHAVGQGAVIWVFIGEIFPNQNRAHGQALGCSTHWVFAALLTLVFPKMVTMFSGGVVFLFFAFMMVLQLVWVKIAVPETKGVPLEEIEGRLGMS